MECSGYRDTTAVMDEQFIQTSVNANTQAMQNGCDWSHDLSTEQSRNTKTNDPNPIPQRSP